MRRHPQVLDAESTQQYARALYFADGAEGVLLLAFSSTDRVKRISEAGVLRPSYSTEFSPALARPGIGFHGFFLGSISQVFLARDRDNQGCGEFPTDNDLQGTTGRIYRPSTWSLTYSMSTIQANKNQNGVGGAFIHQCKKLDFHYCDWAGSSRGMK